MSGTGGKLPFAKLGLLGMAETITLWRPVGPDELRLIEATGMKRFPPRLPEQPVFYPVTTEEYAVKIARDWNVPASGSGYVTRFEVRSDYFIRTNLLSNEASAMGDGVDAPYGIYVPRWWCEFDLDHRQPSLNG